MSSDASKDSGKKARAAVDLPDETAIRKLFPKKVVDKIKNDAAKKRNRPQPE